MQIAYSVPDTLGVGNIIDWAFAGAIGEVIIVNGALSGA
jgi:hypothetical protein